MSSDKRIDVTLQYRDQFTAGFGASLALLSKGTKEAQRAWQSVSKAGDSIAAFGGKLTAGLSLPMAGIASAGTKNFASVDKTLRLVQATMGSTSAEALQLEKSIKSAAASSVYSMQDAADASLNYARQGFNATDAAKMLTPALNLAAGTATDLSQVTGGLGNTLKAFGADASDAAHYADMFAKAQAQANTTTTGLFDAVSIAGSTAQTVGWSFSDLAVLTGEFGDHSISASVGANALNTGLMRIASPAAEGSRALEQLGINVFTAQGNLKSMPDTIAELQRGFAGLSAQEQLAAASSIFGKEQAAKWLVLINGEGSEALQTFKANIEGADGAANSMSDSLLSGLGGSLERLKSSFDVTSYSIGSLLSESLQPFIDRATQLLDYFNNLDPAQQKQIVQWGLMAAAVGPALLVFGKTVSTIGAVGLSFSKMIGTASKVYKGFQSLSLGAKAAQGGLMALFSPAAIVVAAVAAVAVVVVAVVTHFNTFKKTLNVLSPVFQRMQASLTTLKTRFAPIGAVIGKIGKAAWDVFGNGIAAALGVAIGAAAAAVTSIADTMSGIIRAGKGIITFLTGVFTGDWGKAWTGLKETFAGAWEAITAPVRAFIGLLDRVVEGINKVVGAAGSVKGVEIAGLPDNASDGLRAVSRGAALGRRGYGGIPMRAGGDMNFAGGLVQIHERGGEIVDLPHGTRIYPHDKSVEMARSEGRTVTIPKIADQIIVREQADIDRIGEALARALTRAGANRGIA